jgi:hypothetical protein
MTTAFRTYQNNVATNSLHIARLDARESLQTAIQAHASFPAGASLEFLTSREFLEPLIGAQRELWEAQIVGANPGERQPVPDIRSLARQLGLPLPAAAQS